jgi:hypothetical protein
MSISRRFKHELNSMVAATLHFGVWIGALVLLKYLILAQYDIAFPGVARAVLGVLLLAKVVLVLEHVPFGPWVRRQPAWVDVVLRTTLYIAGVVVVLLLERTIRGRSEHGGLLPSLRAAFRPESAHQIWLNVFVIGGALLTYNLSAVVRRHLGKGALLRMLLTPLPETPAAHPEGAGGPAPTDRTVG